MPTSLSGVKILIFCFVVTSLVALWGVTSPRNQRRVLGLLQLRRRLPEPTRGELARRQLWNGLVVLALWGLIWGMAWSARA